MNRTCLPPCLLMLLLAMGCSLSLTPRVVEVREIAAARGAPEIEHVLDLGTGLPPAQGLEVRAQGGQGRAVIGELVLIRGKNFGKQPRVSIGGRGTEVLAHVEDGGVMVRVPWGIDAGDQELEVVHDQGRDSRRLRVDRLGLAIAAGAVYPFSLSGDGTMRLLPTLALPGAAQIVFSFDGSVAYVAGGSQGVTLFVIDLTGPEPRLVGERPVPGRRVIDLAMAEQEPLAVLVTDEDLLIFETQDPLSPSFYAPYKLPPEVQQKGVIAGALDGLGKRLALLLSDLNEVALFDLGVRGKLGQLLLAKALPGQRLSLVQDLRFSSDGNTLWVASGDTARSITGGLQPAQITVLDVARATDGGGVQARVMESWALGNEIAPRELTLARGEPTPPGTAIRREVAAQALYLSYASSSLLTRPDPEAAPASVASGRMARISRGQEPQTLLSGPWVIASQDVVGKTERIVALACRANTDGTVQTELLSVPAWEQAPPRAMSLGPAAPRSSASTLGPLASCDGTVRAQP